MDQKSVVLLSDDVSQGASEEDRRALEQLSKAIEKVRENVRPQYGKARSYPRGFHAADRDFVDNLAWHEVLTRHGADVMVECVGTGLKAGQLVDLVREHCRVPLASRDALMWMSVCYRSIPRAHQETLAIAMREHEKQRTELRQKGAKEANKGHTSRAEAIKAAWASGNFTTRDICADEEWESLGFRKRETARHHLKGMPDPSPWPAKDRSN